jgi:transposase
VERGLHQRGPALPRTPRTRLPRTKPNHPGLRPDLALHTPGRTGAAPSAIGPYRGWLLRNPANLEPDEQRQLDALTQACPALAAVREHVTAFAAMMLNRQGQQLEAWMNTVQADDLPELHSFVTGLRRDFDAARAGLTLPYSSGPVEGHVNRIKMLKRQMYGRANPDLLRKRILLAD